MRYGDLTYKEIKKITKVDNFVIVPTGCTEQQGPHLPVDFDTWFADKLCNSIADEIDHLRNIKVIVLPVTPFGPTPEHRDFGSGFVDIPQTIHEQYIKSVLMSLIYQGFKSIIIWRGCGQHNFQQIVHELNESFQSKINIKIPGMDFPTVWLKYGDPKGIGGHADSFTTSLALFLRPDSVRKELVIDNKSKPVNWDDPNLNFTDYSENGVLGTPIYSSAEIGKLLWNEIIKVGIKVFLESMGY